MHRDVVTVTPDTPLEQAAALLARHKIGGLPVVGDKGEVVGVITETDMLVALMEALATRGGALPAAVRRAPRSKRVAAKVTLKPVRRPRGR
jgi:CBS domain-containing protein